MPCKTDLRGIGWGFASTYHRWLDIIPRVFLIVPCAIRQNSCCGASELA
jgi:hypothetical protein